MPYDACDDVHDNYLDEEKADLSEQCILLPTAPLNCISMCLHEFACCASLTVEHRYIQKEQPHAQPSLKSMQDKISIVSNHQLQDP